MLASDLSPLELSMLMSFVVKVDMAGGEVVGTGSKPRALDVGGQGGVHGVGHRRGEADTMAKEGLRRRVRGGAGG